MRRLPFAALLAALAMLVTAAPAMATDQDVWDAYARSPAAVNAFDADEKFRKAFKRLSDRVTRRRLRVANKASRRLARALVPHRKGVEAAQPSTDDGRRGKALLVKHLTAGRTGANLAARGTRAALDGKRRRASRLFSRSAKALRRAQRLGKRGRAALREAGVDTKASKALF